MKPFTKTCPDCQAEYLTDQPMQQRCCSCRIERQKMLRRVHGAVYRALHVGDLVQQPCEVCGHAEAHAHHDDYSKPLDVRWLCRPHHRQHHIAEFRPEATS